RGLARISPTRLYAEATSTLMNPSKNMLGDLVLASDVRGMLPSPLSLGQSLLLVWPQVTSLIAATCLLFAASYIRFMRQEIRAYHPPAPPGPCRWSRLAPHAGPGS